MPDSLVYFNLNEVFLDTNNVCTLPKINLVFYYLLMTKLLLTDYFTPKHHAPIIDISAFSFLFKLKSDNNADFDAYPTEFLRVLPKFRIK